jgi:uncharacterized protein (DUF1330 family)
MCSANGNREETEMLMNRACAHRMPPTRFSVDSSPDFSFPIKFPIVANSMKIQLKTVAAVLAGVGIGIAAMHGLQGGQATASPAFVISNIEVTNPVGYQKYGEAAAAVVATYHGKILARGGKAVVFDGRAPQRVVMIEFPALADAERWRSSPEFQKLKPLQQQSSKYIESFAIEGVQ